MDVRHFARLMKTLLPITLIIAVAIVGGISLVPTESANACLPCYCPGNAPLNCFGAYSIFNNVDDGGECHFDIYKLSQSGGRQVLSWSLTELNNVSTAGGSVLVGSAEGINFYKVNPGEYQVTYGPDAESKVFVVNILGCPAYTVREHSYVVGHPPEGELIRNYGPPPAVPPVEAPPAPAEAPPIQQVIENPAPPAETVESAPVQQPAAPPANPPANTSNPNLNTGGNTASANNNPSNQTLNSNPNFSTDAPGDLGILGSALDDFFNSEFFLGDPLQ